MDSADTKGTFQRVSGEDCKKLVSKSLRAFKKALDACIIRRCSTLALVEKSEALLHLLGLSDSSSEGERSSLPAQKALQAYRRMMDGNEQLSLLQGLDVNQQLSLGIKAMIDVMRREAAHITEKLGSEAVTEEKVGEMERLVGSMQQLLKASKQFTPFEATPLTPALIHTTPTVMVSYDGGNNYGRVGLVPGGENASVLCFNNTQYSALTSRDLFPLLPGKGCLRPRIKDYVQIELELEHDSEDERLSRSIRVLLPATHNAVVRISEWDRQQARSFRGAVVRLHAFSVRGDSRQLQYRHTHQFRWTARKCDTLKFCVTLAHRRRDGENRCKDETKPLSQTLDEDLVKSVVNQRRPLDQLKQQSIRVEHGLGDVIR